MGFPGDSDGKELTCNSGDQVQSLGWEDPLEKRKATHSSILAWRIPRTVHGVAKSQTQYEQKDSNSYLQPQLKIEKIGRL